MIPDFSVVIPTSQQPALLLKCLDALAEQRLTRYQYEIIIVDDANSPDTAAAVSLFTRQMERTGGPLEVRYLAQPQACGFAAARNRGWRAARGRIIAFTDDDCLPRPTWLSAALPNFDRGAQVVIGHMHLTAPDGSTPYDARTLPVEPGELISANCFCRKSALERVGGFEEAFDRAWREDNDLQFKLMRAGIPISKCPEAVVVHCLRETPWYAPLTNERKSRYDALLYKRHPELFRQRIEVDRTLVLEYYTSVLGVMLGMLGTVAGSYFVTLLGFGIWAMLSVSLIWRRMPDQVDGPRLRQTVLTSLATPFLAVYWRLYGAVKYRVLYW